MILEALVTTLNADGSGHLSPMGPEVDGPDFTAFTLKPFQTSHTFRNLKARGEGVMHVTDDVLLMAQAAVGAVKAMPSTEPAVEVRGVILRDACRFFEFKVTDCDDSLERARLTCEVVRAGSQRAFFGFCRAKHAVLEAAILATRLHLKPADEIEAEFARLKEIVAKTAGTQEREAMAFLDDHWRNYRRRSSAG